MPNSRFIVDDMEVICYGSYHWASRGHVCPIRGLLSPEVITSERIDDGCYDAGFCPILPFEYEPINNHGDEDGAEE